MTEIIFEDSRRNLVIRRSGTYSPSFLGLLNRTVWGSGGLRYTINGMAGILNRIKTPHFLTLTEDHEPVGALTLMSKMTRLEGKDVPAFYSYGLAIDALKRGKGYGTLLAEQALLYGLKNLGDRGIYYGYVEADNIHSMRTLQKVGRKSVGQYHSLLISRLNPRTNDAMEKVDQENTDQIVQLLYEQYKNHSLIDFAYSFKPEDYYILKEGNEIIAGVQCQRNHLTIRYLPGVTGIFITKILPYIPIFCKLLPDRNYQFLTFGNIYVKHGYEPKLFNLIESLLAKYQLYFGMVYMDQRSPFYQRLKTSGKLGIFHAMVDLPVHVMAFLKGFTDREIAEIERKPLFISMMDPV